MKLKKCKDCNSYTMEENCKNCNKKTNEAHYKFIKIKNAPKSSNEFFKK